MENENRSSVDWEKILVYLGVISFLIAFWQGWRDIHKDMSDIKERTARIEVKIQNIEDKQIKSLGKRLTVIETILIMQGHRIKGINSTNEE